MRQEILTIYNASNEPIGSAARSDVHAQGLWHRSVNFLVLDPRRKTVIFQDSNALDMYDAEKFFIKMNGGHAHGENMLQEMARELQDELGLNLSKAEECHFLGIYQVSFEPTKEFINHEFMYFYAVAFSDAFQKVHMDGDEVKAIFEVNIDEAVELLIGAKKTIQVTARDAFQHRAIDVTANSFKNFTDDALYLRLFLALQDLCNGRDRKYIVI